MAFKLPKLSKRAGSWLILFAVLFAVPAIYASVRVWQAKSELEAAAVEISGFSLGSAVGDGQIVVSKLDVVQRHVDAANNALNDPIVKPLRYLPVYGGDLASLAVVTTSSNNLLEAALPALASAVNLQNQLKVSGTAGVDPTAMASFRNGFDSLEQTAVNADAAISNIDLKSLHFGLDNKVLQIKTAVHNASEAVSKFAPVVQVAATIFNTKSEQHWFVGLQNLAEARGTGGILGAYAILHTKDGVLSLKKSGSDIDLDQISSVVTKNAPASLKQLWGVDPTNWRDINASAHFGYSAQLIRDTFYKSAHSRIDGVIFIGQGVVSELLAMTGPVDLGGKSIDSNNAVDFLSKGIYADYSLVSEKNQAVQTLLHELFTKLGHTAPNLKSLWNSIVQPQTGDRILIWSADQQLENQILQDGNGGAISQENSSDVAFTFNNSGANKLDAYLQSKAEYALGTCGVRTNSGYLGRRAKFKLTVTNSAPPTGLPKYVTNNQWLPEQPKLAPGTNQTLITVYAPVGSTENGFTLDGAETTAQLGSDRGHPVYIFAVTLGPGETHVLEIQWVQPIEGENGSAVDFVPSITTPVSLNPIQAVTRTTGFCSANN